MQAIDALVASIGLARALNAQAQYAAALRTVDDATAFADRQGLAADWDGRAVLLSLKATAQKPLGDAAGALASFRQATDIAGRIYGVDNPALVNGHIGIGGALNDLGRPREALDEYAHAQRIIAGKAVQPGTEAKILAGQGMAWGKLGDASKRADYYRRALASLDVLAALAERARTLDWCRPDFVPQPCIEIERGRHPVVEARLAESGAGSFIPNDCRLDAARRLLVITGPNMGGKSTFMRQVALTVLLAAIGSFVPASRCRLGPIDAIHTRIGAADDLANAQSTFMMEMTEAAAILHGATEHSLVLMDEIGRGTSTFDGLALAGAIASHLHDRNRAFALFATHYFELTEFPAKHRHALNMHVSAAESGDDIVFLHAIEPGPASRSYGVQVARLAGMPAAVLRQARQTLDQLEAQKSAGTPQIDLFATPPEPQPELQPELTPEPVAAAAAAVADPHAAAVLEAVRALDPDTLTPRSALDALYQLRALAARTPS